MGLFVILAAKSGFSSPVLLQFLVKFGELDDNVWKCQKCDFLGPNLSVFGAKLRRIRPKKHYASKGACPILSDAKNTMKLGQKHQRTTRPNFTHVREAVYAINSSKRSLFGGVKASRGMCNSTSKPRRTLSSSFLCENAKNDPFLSKKVHSFPVRVSEQFVTLCYFTHVLERGGGRYSFSLQNDRHAHSGNKHAHLLGRFPQHALCCFVEGREPSLVAEVSKSAPH